MNHIKLYEEFISESIKFKDLVDKKFYIEVGSGSTGKTWNEADLTKGIRSAIKHNLFDSEFYYNWTNHGSEYSKVFDKDTLEPLLKNIDKTLNDMFTFKGDTLAFTFREKNDSWIDNWFQTNKSISSSLRKDYYEYRDEYAGVKLK